MVMTLARSRRHRLPPSLEQPEFSLPSVSDDDISWACDTLGLSRDAFSGSDGNDPRLAVIRSSNKIDVEACPGSGKTTLLAAKLAILARNWRDLRRGICVLSHTNVARREIERGIGHTIAAQRLLGYPHFVGTIHGFVNEFLAIPWLRSNFFTVKAIDDEICQRMRWGKLDYRTRSGLEKGNQNQAILRIKKPDFSIGDVTWGRGKLGTQTDTYKALQAACEAVSMEGFHCYDEMFVWANDLLDCVPGVRDTIRERFPVLFIDEVQDNSEMQSAFIHRLFMEDAKSTVRQRLGDANQAIFRNNVEHEAAATDSFPDKSIKQDIPNSHRFGQQIADLANPLAIEPQGLIGRGPPKDKASTDTKDKHAIFLFDDQTISRVLPVYAEYLASVFSPEELRDGSYVAVGAVHRPNGDDHLPRHVAHYWPDYDSELTPAEPKPKTFYQYVMAGQKLSTQSGEAYQSVEKIAEGISHLLQSSFPNLALGMRQRKHRYLLDLLANNQTAKTQYLDLVTAFAVERDIPDAATWDTKWRIALENVAKQIGGGPIPSDVSSGFCVWPSPASGQGTHHQRHKDNLFVYPPASPNLRIRVGSIHSVKGETHTATLVLETYYFDHHLKALKPWLTGKKIGGAQEGKRIQARLKQCYIAMTRPTHLLCLAMRADSVGAEDRKQLRGRGWRIAHITNDGVEWR